MDATIKSRIENKKRIKLVFKNPYTGKEKVVSAMSMCNTKASFGGFYALSLSSRQVITTLAAIGLSVEVDQLELSINLAIPVLEEFTTWKYHDLEHPRSAFEVAHPWTLWACWDNKSLNKISSIGTIKMNDTLEIKETVFFEDNSTDLNVLVYLDEDEVQQLSLHFKKDQEPVKLSFDLLDIVKNEIVSSAILLDENGLGYSEGMTVDPKDKALFAQYRQKFEEAIALIDHIQYSDE